MGFPYLQQLILAGLIGAQSDVITVSTVTVTVGSSISIPCLYAPRFRDSLKFLCKGYWWASCSRVVATTAPDTGGKFSISDDKIQRIFTVTFNNIRAGGNYWCAVEANGQKHRAYFKVIATTGEPSLYVDRQEIAALERGSVTVKCHYEYGREQKWCRPNSTCVAGPSGAMDGATVAIDRSVPRVFAVTMSGLTTGNSGWYWCQEGNLQMPVRLSVSAAAPVTTTAATGMSPTTASSGTLSATLQHSSCTAQPSISTATEEGGKGLQSKSSNNVTILVSVLASQLLVILAALFAWRMLRRRKTKPEGSETAASSQPGISSDMIYSNVVYNKHNAAAQKEQDHPPPESVTYSTVVIGSNAEQTTEPQDDSVIYSKVGPH